MIDAFKILSDSGVLVYVVIFLVAELLIIATFIHAYIHRKKERVMQFEAYYKQKYGGRLWGSGSLFAVQYLYYVILKAN